jgi:ribosomal protein S18 acetylase RimI-like enzyme
MRPVTGYLANPLTVLIRSYRAEDWPQLWPILRTTIASGDTYAFPPDSTEEEIKQLWIEAPMATHVACAEDGTLIGSYKIQPNQPGLGSHVCNCGYVVSPAARGRGVAAIMCEHSQAEAVRLGFLAMQFNLVVVTNVDAVHLWRKLGFQIVGTLPNAFRHRQLGFVDAHVMYKKLPPRLP